MNIILVAIIVGMAVIYMVRHFIVQKSNSGCGKGCGCTEKGDNKGKSK